MKILCTCGCGKRIPFRPWHKWRKTPIRFIRWHHMKVLYKTMSATDRERRSWQGRKHTDATKRKISKQLRGKVSPCKGKTYEDIYGSERAQSLRGIRSLALRGRTSPLKGRTYEDIHGVKKAKRLKKLRADDRIIKKIMSHGSQRPNGLERTAKTQLDKEHPDMFVYCGNGSVVINGKCPDFISKKLKTVVLVHGTYWHLLRQGLADTKENRRRAEIKDSRPYRKAGWQVMFIWGRGGRH